MIGSQDYLYVNVDTRSDESTELSPESEVPVSLTEIYNISTIRTLLWFSDVPLYCSS